MGTIIRITGNGVFIETNLPTSSMDTCSSNLFEKMCNNMCSAENVINVNDIDQHTIMQDSDNSVHAKLFKANAISRTKSSELDVIG